MEDLWRSKKFVALVVGLGVVVAANALRKVGVEVPHGEVLGVIGMVSAYLLGQGVADYQKSATLVAAKSAADSLAMLSLIGAPRAAPPSPSEPSPAGSDSDDAPPAGGPREA